MRTPADSLQDHEMELQQLNYTVIESQTLWISYAMLLGPFVSLSGCLILFPFLSVVLK